VTIGDQLLVVICQLSATGDTYLHLATGNCFQLRLAPDERIMSSGLENIFITDLKGDINELP